MKLTIRNQQGQSQGEIEVGFPVIENGRGTQSLHDTIVAFRAAQRSGTACTKTMGEVAGSGKKPWRQKGTGRARAGSFASPLWRGGGVVFGPKPRDFSKKVNQKTRQVAFQKALSERLKSGDVIVVDELGLSAPRTREFLAMRKALQINGTTLVVASDADRNLNLAARNVPGVEVTSGQSVNAWQLLRFDKLLFSRAGWEQVGRRIRGQNP